MSALLALTSAALFGVADFAGGYATRRTPVLTVTLISNLVGVVMGVLLVATIGGVWSPAAVGWGVAGGMFGLVGVLLFYLGLASGPNRLVSPVGAVVAALLPVLVGVLSGERPGLVPTVGLFVSLPAIWFVAGGDLNLEDVERRPLGLAVGAGVGFGLFLVCLAQTPEDAGATPLAVARLTSTALLALVALVQRPNLAKGTSVSLPIVAGSLDMAANGLYLWSTRGGELAIVGVLVNLFPVTTVALAMVVLHERLSRTQAVGLVLAVAAAAMLSW